MTTTTDAIAHAWAFLVPLLSISIFSCCIFFVGSLVGLLYSHRQEKQAVFKQKAILYSSMIGLLFLEAVISIWDSFIGTHFPVEISIPIKICVMVYGGRAAFHLCVLRIQELNQTSLRKL